MPFPLVLAAAVASASISGTVRSADGAPVHAHVHLAGAARADVDTDARGAFALTIPAGTYRVTITAVSFAPAESDLVVHDGERLDVALAALGGGRLREIGRIAVDGSPIAAAAAVPAREIDRTDLDASGYDRVVEALGNVPSLTLTRPNGGSSNVPAVVSLRGPDPSETRITVDGQKLNDTSTGDLDLALFPTSVLSAIDIGEGLGPEDHRGADTIGGEIDLISLRPTETPHQMLRLSEGSFGTTSEEANLTGRLAKFGYAFAAGNVHENGYVENYPVLLTLPDGSTTTTRLGSSVTATTLLANLTYAPTPSSLIRVREFVLDDVRDESAALNSPADPTATGPGSLFVGSGPQTRSQQIHATLAQGTFPLGAGSVALTQSFSTTDLTVNRALGTAAAKPYDYTLADDIETTTAEWTRASGNATFALGGESRGESLDSPDQGFIATLSERENAAWLRASEALSSRVRVAASVVFSDWSTFGRSTDGRLGITIDDRHDGVYRFNVGTGFRAPLLAEQAVLPAAALAPDANCVAFNGNPNEHAEHATEYEAGYGKTVGTTTFDASLYRTNLRDPIENFYPLGTSCPVDGQGNPISTVVAQSYPINVGNVVYQGATLRVGHRFGFLSASVEYGLNAAYPTNLPNVVAANPTSGSNLSVDQQFAGIPLETLTLGLRYAHDGFHGAANLTGKSTNNELAQGRFATLDAAVGRTLGNVDITLAGTNLTNAVAGRFTELGIGTPYPTSFGNIPQDALYLEPAAVRLILTVR